MLSLRRIVSLGLVVAASILAAQQPRAREPEKRLEAVRQLGLARLPAGALPTFYSAGAEQRARYFQTLISGERDFYMQKLHVSLGDLNLAVLSPQDWPLVNPHDPYGMPSVEGHPRVIAMPAELSRSVVISVPDFSSLSPHLQKEVRDTGKPLRELVYVGADSIGTHELGHAILEDYGIGWTTHWFNEFLASYVGNIYIAEKRPADLAANRIFWETGLGYPHPHTSLDYFESHYDELSAKEPQNYGWYECALDQRVLAIYRKEGLGLLPKIKAAFPPGGPQRTSAQVLDTLERIDPGWKQWASEMEADRARVTRPDK
jgi:hypothetical protein